MMVAPIHLCCCVILSRKILLKGDDAVNPNRWIALAVALLCGVAGYAAAPIEDRIVTSTITLPQPLEATSSSWCTWGTCFLGPRLYLAPRSDGTHLVGWTDNTNDGHVSVVSREAIISTHTFAGKNVRGLVAHGDGTYAVLLKDGVTLFLSKRSADGSQLWITNLNSTLAEDSSSTGDHRLAFGGGFYAAYWSVYGITGGFAGHDGDQLSYVDDSGIIQSGGWNFGCSHSMAQLVGYHSGDLEFTAFCSSDCYPQPPGLKMNYTTTIQIADGDCHGNVSLQLGQMAAAGTGWKVLFNAEDTPESEAYGIGFATAGGSATTSVVWLTNTDGSTERDPVVAGLGTQDPELYLVGWTTSNDGAFHIGRVNAAGAFLEGPEHMSSSGPGWNKRDNSFATTSENSVVWLEGSAQSTTLRLYRYNESIVFVCDFESGDTAPWS